MMLQGEHKTEDTQILAHLSNQRRLPDSDIRSILASSHQRSVPCAAPSAPTSSSAVSSSPSSNASRSVHTVNIDGRPYYSANAHRLRYHVAAGKLDRKKGSLIDRGANGGMIGSDARFLAGTGRFADVSGIADHTVENIEIGTAAGLVRTQNGPVIVLMHQYANYGQGNHHSFCRSNRNARE